LLAEVQEPEDLSILLEWENFDLDGEKDGHLGLGFDLALTAVERTERSADNVEALIQRRVTQGNSLPSEASRFFRLDKVEEREHFDAGFGIVIALSESVQLTTEGGNHHLAPGSTMLIPFSAGAFTLEGSALLARPPSP